jgi:ABC-type amino acid transport substrate-binding protein
MFRYIFDKMVLIMKKAITIIGIVIILIILAVVFTNRDNKELGVDTIRLGYIIYPPLLEKNLSSGELSGVSYDIVEAVADELGVQTEWAEEVGWGTALEGLNTRRYDVLGTQMWPNAERERVAIFSDAPMNSVLYGYVKKGDTRFNDDLSKLNSSEYKITYVDGELAMFIAQEDYPNAKTISLPQLSSYAEVFLNIVQGKADISFNEPSAVEDFLASNPNTLERVSGEPVRSFGNSFAFNKQDTDLVREWNKAIKKLSDNGTIQSILEKYGVENYYLVN